MDAPTETIEQLLTSPGVAMGTVAYMSPEQARGEELDARTDLFTLARCSTRWRQDGRPSRGIQRRSIHEAILNRAPKPALRMNPDLPSKLDEIINRAMEDGLVDSTILELLATKAAMSRITPRKSRTRSVQEC